MNMSKYPQLGMKGAGANQIVSTEGFQRLMNVRKIGDPNSKPEEFVEVVN